MAALVSSSEAQRKIIENPHVKLEKQRKLCCFSAAAQCYALHHKFALVRHADRLDMTPEWDSYPHRTTWPNDTPLTQTGQEHAQEVGGALSNVSVGSPFGLIVSSPYLRCAQTASAIAQKLNVPVRFDEDLGEVFDEDMGSVDGIPQHRAPEELEKLLLVDYPNVKYIRDEHNKIKIAGRLPTFPESLVGARMRYCYKVQLLVQQAATHCTSLVIVTHADALAAVSSFLRPSLALEHIPYAAHIIASRRVKVLEKGSEEVLEAEPVYRKAEQNWTVEFSPEITFKHNPDWAAKRANDQKKMKGNSALKELITSGISSSDLRTVSINGRKKTPTLTKQQLQDAVDTLVRLKSSNLNMEELISHADDNAGFSAAVSVWDRPRSSSPKSLLGSHEPISRIELGVPDLKDGNGSDRDGVKKKDFIV